MEALEESGLGFLGLGSVLVEAMFDKLGELLGCVGDAGVEVDDVELLKVGSFFLSQRRTIEARKSIGKDVENPWTVDDGEVVLEQREGPVIQHLGFV